MGFLALVSTLSNTVSAVYNPVTRNSNIQLNRENLVQGYFLRGFTYQEIISFLALAHGITISLRQLLRILRKMGLTRKREKSSSRDIMDALMDELKGSGSSVGYRDMHQHLIGRGNKIDRENVRLALNIADPQGVAKRSKHRLVRRKYVTNGPNYSWHIDGNDKLKPFGFSIHGAIDGYSRSILWLTVAPSNKDPAFIAKYYTDYVKAIAGAPRKIRADRGVENVHIAGIQRFLRRNHGDGLAGSPSFIFGKSVSNQRIEAWWSILQKNSVNWWMNYFKYMRDRGIFDDSSPIHCECLQFSYFGILQLELSEVVEGWNNHRIRLCRNTEGPSGRPDVLYFLSHLKSSRDYKVSISDNDIALAVHLYCKERPTFGCSDEFVELASILMDENDLVMPSNADEAEMLYLDLLSAISRI